MLYTKDEILERLRNEVVEVTFIKKDGEYSTKKMTLRADLLPEKKQDHVERPRGPEDLISAWSLNDEWWRAFYVDNVRAMVTIDD